MNNMNGHIEHYEVVLVLIRTKMMYCIYKDKIYSQGVIINS